MAYRSYRSYRYIYIYIRCLLAVSLPGAGTGPTEQPTILLINGIADEATKQANRGELKLQLHEEQKEQLSTQQHIQQVPTTPGGSHLLDLESHLIEDVDAQLSGVGINELPPIEQELQQGTSKAELDCVADVFEVEPAGAKTKQPIETLAPSHQQAEVDETATATAKAEEPVTATATEREAVAEEVRQTAEQLVHLIERELIENLSRDVEQAREEHEQKRQGDLNDLNSLSQQVDAQLNELTSILKSKPQPEIVLERSANELKVIEVPTPKSEAEEQQRKEFIDSLPQIGQDRLGTHTDADAKRLSADCKREYYQSLKKYLLQSSLDKPPVPLQTYRWEDLRRARERVGYLTLTPINPFLIYSFFSLTGRLPLDASVQASTGT